MELLRNSASMLSLVNIGTIQRGILKFHECGSIFVSFRFEAFTRLHELQRYTLYLLDHEDQLAFFNNH